MNTTLKIFIGVSIITLWIIFNFIHIKKEYFPDESLLPIINNNKLLNILENKEVTNDELTILHHKKEIGKISYNLKKQDTTKRLTLLIIIQDTQNNNSLRKNIININSNFVFSQNYDINSSKIHFLYHEKKLDAKFNFNNQDELFNILIKKSNKELIKISSLQEFNKYLSSIKNILKLTNIDPNYLNILNTKNISDINTQKNKLLSNLKITIREGKVQFGHIRIDTIILEYRTKEKEQIKAYFDKQGNILKIGPYKNFQLISRSILPLMKKTN